MSAYSTPTRTCFDEGFSPCSNQSLYFTPRESFSYCTPQTRSRNRATPYKGKIPKFNIYDQVLSPSQENIRKEDGFPGVSSPIPISGGDGRWRCQNAHSAKEAVISIDKENIGVQFCSTPSLLFKETPNINFTPLKNISNQPNEKNAGTTVFEARISSIGKHFDVRIRTEADADQLTKCSVVQNSPILAPSNIKELSISPQEKKKSCTFKKNGTFFRGFALGRKLRRKSTRKNSKSNQNSSTMVDHPTQNDNDSKSEYFGGDAENTNVPKIQDELLQVKTEISTPVKNLPMVNSCTPLLIKKTPPQRVKFWPFTKIRRLRISPVKRLFTKPTRYFILFKEKIAERLSLHPIKTLLNLKSEEVSCIAAENDSIKTQQICTLCLENLSNKEETMSRALSVLMAKLSSMEEELKEIKGLVKNNANNISSQTRNALPPLPRMAPPPPPPPPPSNFLISTQSSGTLKRKADLTTPENVDHAVKRPAIKNEKTQFSITVEDLRSVKLRKTPAHVFKPHREIKESNSTHGEEMTRSSRIKKNRQGVTNGKNGTQSLAELITSSGYITNNTNSIPDSSTPVTKNLSTICLHEETPVTSKSTLTNNRSQKRKEWLIESPIRKRANTGNNSSIYYNTASEH